MMKQFSFTVIYINSYLEDEVTAHGIVFATDFGDACRRIEAVYTSNVTMVCKIQVEILSDEDEETYCVYQTDSNWNNIWERMKDN